MLEECSEHGLLSGAVVNALNSLAGGADLLTLLPECSNHSGCILACLLRFDSILGRANRGPRLKRGSVHIVRMRISTCMEKLLELGGKGRVSCKGIPHMSQAAQGGSLWFGWPVVEFN